ncbi:hypothetical protein LXL04_028513 [Taraxacum kok-saghyz]
MENDLQLQCYSDTRETTSFWEEYDPTLLTNRCNDLVATGSSPQFRFCVVPLQAVNLPTAVLCDGLNSSISGVLGNIRKGKGPHSSNSISVRGFLMVVAMFNLPKVSFSLEKFIHPFLFLINCINH